MSLRHTTVSSFIVSAAMLVSTAVYSAEPAGQVIAVKGEVTAQALDGTSRNLTKSDQVFVGENILTGSGAYAVIEFIDGAKATMRPDSNLSVNKYAFGTEDDGAVLELVKGGFRAITGEIAHNRPDSYKVQTNVATLGVRGTEFAIILCEKDCAAQGGETAELNDGGVTGHGYFVSN
ncbi:FecR domain-containing protein [Pseudomonadota bacterium]